MIDEPIAVIGLDARFPGDGDTAERFYEFLLEGRSAQTSVPADRYNADAFWHPDADRAGSTRVRSGHFLKGSIAAFDAPFFSITPTEASSMDPQQRGMLESVYRALENAGIPLAKAAGSQTGVYVGCMYSDYDRMTTKDLDIPSKYAALGTVYSMLSNRVSWCFDLRGPSITIDTACSSSLVALHQACNSLKLRESSMAIVGGCNLIISPEFTLLLDAAGVLGPDGRSYSFDHRGNGYSRGEGFGVVVLKRVSDAIRDGDTIRAVIRNSGSNQDGRSPGITQPTRAAQTALIRDVYARASLDPALTRFFEAHGTGTAVGDPIEAGAISDVFTPHRSAARPLYIGALKSNIGHLEGAAGVAAVIKGVLTLENGVIPANTWFEKVNPKILDSWYLRFPTEASVWPQAGLRRMSINSFGVGGSNAHVVMDDALHFLSQYHLVGNHRTVAEPKLPGHLSQVQTNGSSSSSSLPNGVLTNGIITNGFPNGSAPTNGVTNGHITITSNGGPNGGPNGRPPRKFGHGRKDSGIALPCELPSEPLDSLSSSTSSLDAAKSTEQQTNGLPPPPNTVTATVVVTANADASSHSLSLGLGQENDNGCCTMMPQNFNFNNSNGNSNTITVDKVRTETSTLQLFVMSSYDQDGVSRIRSQYSEYLSAKSSSIDAQFLRDFSYTLACKRTHHGWRSFSIAKSKDTLLETLGDKTAAAPTRAISEPRLAFIFTGQGAQWATMGRDLMAFPAFRQSLYEADMYLNSLGCPWSLTFELCKDANASKIDDAEYSQPICTALQIALLALLSTWSIRPHAVAGHSSGEIAAAFAAGQISKEAAWRIAYHRGRLSARLARSGTLAPTGMAAVALDRDRTLDSIRRVHESLVDNKGSLEIACMNSPESHTVSGDLGKIEALVNLLQREKVFARKLVVEIAYHSSYLQPIAQEYLESIGDISQGVDSSSSSSGQKVEYFSSLLGTAVDPSRLQDPQYWVDNLLSPVRFTEAVTEMLKGPAGQSKVNGFKAHSPSAAKPITDFLEIGPHSALKGPLRAITAQVEGADKVMYQSLLKRKEGALNTALEAAGSLFCRGFDVNLLAVNQAAEPHSGNMPLMLTDLPAYPFDHSKECWYESRISRNFRSRPFPRHELLGAPVSNWNEHNAAWRNYIRLSENPWIEHHRVSGDIIYPAAGMLVMAIEASRQLADKERSVRGFLFRDVSFHLALRVPENDAVGVESHFYLRALREAGAPSSSAVWREFQLFTQQEGEWREHCRGLVQVQYEMDDETEDRMVQEDCDVKLAQAQSTCTNKITADKVYRSFGDTGLEFGPTFRTLKEVGLGVDLSSLVTVDSLVSSIREEMPHRYLQPHLIHPSTLDGLLQANLAPLVLSSKRRNQAIVPTHADELWVSAGPFAYDDSYKVATQPRPHGRQDAVSSFTAVHTDSGRAMAYASGLNFKTIAGASVSEDESKPRLAWKVDWKPDASLLSREEALRVFGLPVKTVTTTPTTTEATTQQVETDDPSKRMDDWDALCLQYMRHFLSSTPQETIEKMEPHHQRYVAWMQYIVDKHSQKTIPNTVPELEEKVQQANTPEGKLITAVGQSLREMLTTRTRDPLDVIFKDKIAENVYRDGLGSKRCYAQLRNYVDALAHRNPGMRVLEVGAGTGGATRPVIDTLGRVRGVRFTHYDFTDISPSFFEHAREDPAFEGQLGRMSFRVLNAERAPAEQGFEGGGYDLVVAANVLHATVDIDNTLRNVRSLLRPGGKLVMFELTSPDVLLGGFCFGPLPGWWLSEDEDRVWGPLMSTDTWEKHLKASGFTGVDAAFNDFPNPAYQTSSILVSTVPPAADVAKPLLSSQSHTYLLIDETSTLQKQVAEGMSLALSHNGSSVQIISLASPLDADLKDSTCVMLAELDAPILGVMTESLLATLKRITKESKTLVWLSQGGTGIAAAPDRELVTGLARTIRSERPGFNFITVSFEQSDNTQMIVDTSIKILGNVQDGAENSFRIVDGLPYISRLVEAGDLSKHIQDQTGSAPTQAVQQKLGVSSDHSISLQIGTLGLLDTMRFEDDASYGTPLADDEVEFKVVTCGLNVSDVAVALGKRDETPLGLEASGIVTRVGSSAGKFKVGDRVFGLCFNGAMKTHARTPEGLLTKMADDMTFADASSISVAYMTAYAVLHETGTIRKGDTVLIHAGAGDVAQAALQIAQHHGAEIFATVSKDEERDLLEAKYNIPHDHIFSNQDLSFKMAIKRTTSGRGVNLILNTLTGEGMKASWECLAPGGRFVDLGAADVNSCPSTQQLLPLSNRQNKRFESFDLVSLAKQDPAHAQRVFQGTVEFISNELKPALNPNTVYPFSEAATAFRCVQSGEHSTATKLVLEFRDEDSVPVVPSKQAPVQFSAEASYVIAGGLGGLGRSVARWMASRGARNLILLSRRGPVDESARQLVEELRLVCDNVATPACDVTDEVALRGAVAECLTRMPPVRGCIQGSMVLKDNRFEQMTLDDWQSAVRPKVDASWNLHRVLTESNNDLDFLVLLSSTVGLMGNPEQSNYAAGNTFQDAFAQHLASSPKPLNAVSLDLPVILDAGFVAEKPELLNNLQASGWAYMELDELHATLDFHCHRSTTTQAAQAQAVPRMWLPQQTAAEGMELPPWRHDPLFSHLRHQMQTDNDDSSKQQKSTAVVKHATLLAAASSPREAETVVLDALLDKLSRVLSVEVSNLEPGRPLHAFGVDSLVAVELRAWLAKELCAELSVFEMTNNSSLYALAGTAAERSRLVRKFEGEGEGGGLK